MVLVLLDMEGVDQGIDGVATAVAIEVMIVICSLLGASRLKC